jgi:hypothetical protein
MIPQLGHKLIKPPMPGRWLPHDSKLHFVEIPYPELVRFYHAATKSATDAAAELKFAPRSSSRLDELARNWRSNRGFYGGTIDEVKNYMRDGYRVGQLNGELLPGVLRTREGTARRGQWLWQEHGDDVDVGLALSGDPDCFRSFEQAPTLGGLNVVALFAFSSNTDFNIIAQYGGWIARLLGTCQTAGISPSLTIDQYGRGVTSQDVTSLIRVKVKNENDALDWRRYSVLFSPPGFRHLLFAALCRATGPKHLIPGDTASHLGSPLSPSGTWDLAWDSSTRTVTCWGPTSPRSFDPDHMTNKLIETGALTPREDTL